MLGENFKAILESVRTFQGTSTKILYTQYKRKCWIKYSFNFPFLGLIIDKTYCLTMYYHMYGDTTNTLTVRTQKGNNAAIDRWQRAGDHGNAWHRLSGLSLPLDPDTKVTFGYQNIQIWRCCQKLVCLNINRFSFFFQIFIEATKGSSYTGDIAIDYIELWPFACP